MINNNIFNKFWIRFLKIIVFLFTETVLLFLLLFIALIVFIAITKIVFVDEKTEIDIFFFENIKPYINNINTSIMLFFSEIGNFKALVVGNLLLIFYFLFIAKHRWFAVKVPAIALSSLALMFSLKELFNRERPLLPLFDPAIGLSFPSGHAMSSITFYGLLIYLAFTRIENQLVKIFLILSLIIIILMIGISRVYLRVHYFSDVLAGFSVGILWLWASIKILNSIEVYTRKEVNKVNE